MHSLNQVEDDDEDYEDDDSADDMDVEGDGQQLNITPQQIQDFLASDEVNQLREQLRANPENMESILNEWEQRMPIVIQFIRMHPEVLEAIIEDEGDEVLDEEAIGELLNEMGQGGYGDMDQEINPADVQGLINNVFGGGQGNVQTFDAQATVTDEEKLAIERLMQLGFPYNQCLQAYFACGKNEEAAANFLFDNPTFGTD